MNSVPDGSRERQAEAPGNAGPGVWLLPAALAALALGAAIVLRRSVRRRLQPFAPIFIGESLEAPLTESPATLGIAHNGGDTKEGMELVRAHNVDVVEIDVALVGGRLDVVHTPPRIIPRLLHPLVYTSATLDDAWRELPAGVDVYLDLKTRGRRTANEVVRVIEGNGERTIYAGSSDLPTLGFIRSLLPDAETVFYPRTRMGLARLLAMDPLPVRGISIPPDNLDAAVVRRAQGAGLFVWTGIVNDRRRVREVLDWQVDGLISDDLVVLAGLREGRVGA
ncbi:MAG: hypothetical protein GEU28_07035 [Dehalococcoidia bacterium]|nr:hypothetical protein [Dehalococcoidia bacterium]